MNSQITGNIVTENLSIKTYQKIEKYLTQCGEKNPTLQRIKGILQNYFDCILSQHGDGNFDRGETDFEETKNRILPFLQKALTEEQKDDLQADLLTLYMDGFFSGYIVGARDIESMLNDLDERTEE